jgi:protein-S-isoprenylcysteine O-methyltransferase Ste14
LSIQNINKYLFVLFYSSSLKLFGAGLIFIGLILSSIASLSLGKSWRIGIDDKEKTDLVTDGIYRISRNPYFLSYDIVLIGMVLCLLSVILIITASITIVLFHVMILREEKYLESNHGESYLKYKKEVRRYI